MTGASGAMSESESGPGRGVMSRNCEVFRESKNKGKRDRYMWQWWAAGKKYLTGKTMVVYFILLLAINRVKTKLRTFVPVLYSNIRVFLEKVISKIQLACL